jgi:hypothetical protein
MKIQSSNGRSEIFAWLATSAITATLLVVAMSRFYRRFIFDEPTGRVWGLADDVYISACFGRMFVRGEGLLWYRGAPHVEGITNPLWSVLIGLLHLLPGFTQDRVGLFVVALNCVLLTLASLLAARWLFGCVTERVTVPIALAAVPFVLCGASLPYWSAEGFEVALIACFAFGGLLLAEQQRSLLRKVMFGVLLAAGMATRMDFALIALPAVFVSARGSLRGVLTSLAVTAMICAALLLTRHAYFGDWMPNTYYLKATGWPLAHRWAMGAKQNYVLLRMLPALCAPLLIPHVRHALGHRWWVVASMWFSFSATVLYSTYMGGDSWRLFAGYDRHTVVGSWLMLWGCVVVVCSLGGNRIAQLASFLWLLGVASAPFVLDVRARAQVVEGVISERVPLRVYERDWIQYGKVLQEIAEPTARVAVCPAGAIIYFSNIGGVDLLGKVDPYVAHLPVSFRKPKDSICWQNAPGHNKENDPAVFDLRKPEISRYQPPPAHRKLYKSVRVRNQRFFMLRSSPLIRWDDMARQR